MASRTTPPSQRRRSPLPGLSVLAGLSWAVAGGLVASGIHAGRAELGAEPLHRILHLSAVALALVAALALAAASRIRRRAAAQEGSRERELQAEAAARSGEARFRAVFQNAGFGISVTDGEGRFLEVNPEMAAFLGYTQQDLLRLRNEDVTHPDDLDATRANVERLFDGEMSAYTQEKRYRRKDGRLAWGLLAVTAIRDPEGRTRSAIGIVADITRRKRMESELALAAQRLSLATQGAGIGIWDWDVLNDVLVWDDNMFRLYGLRQGEFGGAYQAWTRALDPADRQRVEEDIRAALRGEREYGPEFRIRWPDGSVHHLQAAARTLRDAGGRPIRMAGINIDITGRKLAEEQVRRNEGFLKAVADALPGMIGYWTRELRCTFANRHYLEWFGRSPEQMIGITIQELLGEELFRKNEPYIRGALAGEAQRFERTLTKADGSTGYTWAHYVPDVAGGEVRGFFVLVSDITELKRTQLELQRLNEALQERTRQAESASRAKSDFLANMSHEIRTPMNAIMGLAQLLERSHPSPGQQEYLARIRVASRNLLALVNDVLDLSKIEADKLELEHVAFELGDVFRQVEDLLSERAREKGLTLACVLPPDVPVHLVGDPLRLGQVLLNLAGNAVKFTEHGGVWVAVERAGSEAGRARLRFTIRDTGIGIPPEALTRLFQAFSQADSSTTRRFGGTGLGLTISRRLVKRMGGQLSVESAPAQGSTFSFVLPLEVQQGEAARPEAARSSGPAAVARRGRVLLAEDNETNRLVAREFLESAGMVVEEAHDGREAIEKALRPGAAHDVVLMDIQMPEVDGWEATVRIRAERPALPIVAVTAHAMEAERKRCLDAGMSDYIGKPFEAEELRRVVERWLPASAPAAPAPAGGTASSTPDGDPPAAGERFLSALRRDVEVCLERVRQARSAGDIAQAREASHALKGLALPPAFSGLREAARALERAARAGDPWLVRAEALERSARELLQRVPPQARAPEAVAPAAPVASAAAELRPVLEGLAAALRRRSLSAKEQLDALRVRLGPDPRVLRIEEAVDRVQFAEAEAGLRALASSLGVPLGG